MDQIPVPSWISKPIDKAKSALNIVRSIGPFIISQSDSASEAFARHQARLAGVDAGKELLIQEIHTLGEVRKQLLERYIAADAEQRIRIRHDLDEINASLRQLNIGTQALNYLTTSSTGPNPSTSSPPSSPSQPEVTEHWMDKFQELAREHNEEWRETLLARALAAESSIPGTVSPRALWLLGTLEETAFNAFATLLDLSAVIGGAPMIASGNLPDSPIPDCSLGANVTIPQILYRISEIGLVATVLTATRLYRKGNRFTASYGGEDFLVACVGADISIVGVIPTRLGDSIASFYDRKFNPLGKEIFDKWISGLDKRLYTTERIH